MSLILEALKRSERERQRGAAADLLAPQWRGPRRRGSAVAWLLLGATVVLALIVYFGWPDAEPAVAPSKTAASDAALLGLVHSEQPATLLAVDSAPRTEQKAQAIKPANAVPSIAQSPPAVAVPEPLPPLPAATEPRAANELEVRSIETLSASQRAQLPDLKISLHVYASDPAQRFVIIDGQRLSDGSVINAELSVESIDPEGVILRWQNTYLRLNRS